MSQKIKFSRLHIPKNNRKNENSNSTTVSRFFSQPNSTNNGEGIQISNVTQSQDTKLNNFVTEQVKFTTTNNTDQPKNVPETENLPQNQKNHSECRETNLETTTATSKTRKTTIQKFFDESSDTDFEISAKQQKKTFSSKISYQEKKNKLKKRKRQPKINNMLLRDEMILSKMLVEQSIAENVNPDEMQLALALSRSEIEISHNTEQTMEDSPMNIQKKLKKYEFKPSSRSDDTDNFPFLIFTKSKTKWANKFTPLTLRNPHKQSQKVHENIDKLLNQQENQISLTTKEEENINKENNFILTSDLLVNQKSEENYIFNKCALEDLNDIQNYYVTDLFTPSKVKAGHLLRDYRKIPGRDLSPINSNKTCESDEKNRLLKVIESDTASCTSSPSSNSIVAPESLLQNSSNQITLDKNYENIKSVTPREQSPDLFDETEMHAEDAIRNIENSFEIEKLQENDIEHDDETLNVYEKFSSDEDDKKSRLQVYSKQSILNNNDKEGEFKENINDLKLPIKILEISEENHRDLSNKEMQIGTNTEFDSEVNIIDLTDDCSSDYVDNEECINDDKDEIVCSQELKFIDSPENDEPDVDNEQFIDDDKDENVLSQELKFIDSPVNDEPDVDNEQFIDNDKDEIVFSQELKFIDSPENDESPIVIDSDEDDVQNSIQSKDYAFQNEALLKEHPAKSQSQKQCTNFSKNSTNDSERIEENCSQNSLTNDDYDIIILSDDEINYSIRRTNNKIFESNIDEYDLMSSNADSRCDRINENSNFEQDCSKSQNFSFLDLISVNNKIDLESNENDDNAEDNNLLAFQSQEKIIIDEIQSEDTNKDGSYKITENLKIACHQEDKIFNESFFDLKKLKAQFGISDEKISNKLNEKKIKHPRIELSKTSSYRKSLSESFTKCSPSFLNENKTKSFQQFQRSSNKFKEFINEDVHEDFDEFDKMVYGSPEKKIEKSQKNPENFDQLLTGKINLIPDMNKRQNKSEIKEIFCDGKVYLMKTENVPEKPDFRFMDSPTRLKELYRYGLKPLKKKQAIIMLEYIYNQTHPFIENNSIERQQQNNFEERGFNEEQNSSDEEKLIDKEKKYNKFKLKNSFGDVLLKEDEIAPECDNEEYYFPTNVRSKVSTALLPLHLAWFNLVKSSNSLRETLLHYEPIDLQEIYLFFKGLGYRYNPKDMKKFFDSRCIIFRYDLGEGNNNNNRHVKKLFTKKTKNCVK